MLPALVAILTAICVLVAVAQLFFAVKQYIAHKEKSNDQT